MPTLATPARTPTRHRNPKRPLPVRSELDPLAAAQQARLRYVSDDEPGILRARSGRGFTYRDPNGAIVRHPETLSRIRSLVIPPAWKRVWICRHANGHLQATGRDARGRKQYKYHPRWRSVRDETKFDKIIAFARALPTIRKAVEADLAQSGFTKRKVVAAVVRLLELSLIRVGNEEYARTNNTYGLTTLRDEHATILGGSVEFRFRGKSGIRHKVEVRDRKLARVVARCQAIPGQILFQYKDEEGAFRPITSTDVNDYLREVASGEFSAKDFRTWAGTVLAAACLREMHEAIEEAKATKSTLARAVERVADRLGNSPSVCRKAYIHPAVCESYLAGTLLNLLGGLKPTPADGLDDCECLVASFLEQISSAK